jgi:hypothetical protein
MSDENIPSSRGRWDHLLREIPTQPTRIQPSQRRLPKLNPLSLNPL